jgi:hypothetical protein
MRVKVGESDTFAGQCVNVWCIYFSTKRTQVRVTHIVGENYHDVRSLGGQDRT